MNYIFKTLLILFALISMQSCFVTKDYERPEDRIEAISYRTDELAKDSVPLSRLSWKQMFTDSILQHHIEEALENNQDIRIALQQISIANSYYKQGKAGFYPSVALNASYTRQELSPNSQFGGFFSSVEQYELNSGLSWEADIWGKLSSNKRAAQARFMQTQAAHKLVKTNLISRMASGYYRLLALDEQVKITQETLKSRTQSLETSKALKQAGNLTSVAVSQTEAQVYAAQAILLSLKNDIKLLENTLSILKGISPEPLERSAFSVQNLDPELTTGVASDLLENRPDVIAAEYELINAFELTNAARARFYPSVTISATGGFQSLNPSNFISPNSLFLNLIGGLTQPIFNRREIKTGYEVAGSEKEQALLNFEKTLLTASREVSDALLNYQNATQRIEVKTKEYEAYQTALEDSRELLNNGLANYLEVLNAQENALNTKLEVSQIRFDKFSAIVDLYRSLGGGWQ
ncbi:efflux transporter outer membrane subunit [Psychroflexus sp. YR1-1]|uniref:Efflux transporter outer membrane subunit n=1 Tax=Psychroflexus aurantiacus TaxID=2709310 RepID=A0A6B3R1Y8_9FLAO|nr:efflux transporter outer membrane subunit [Psychroflexus aurantiacus]NEV93480.1 efflux transporter outer membrane subunit [Psychroflexus aurantiacus]